MRLYRALLYLYPSSWRAEFGAEMCLVFASRRQEARGAAGLLALWLATIPDLFLNAMAVQWDVLSQDLRHALRALRRAPGFTFTAVAIAGIGIGATAAAFTMLNHVLLRPLPFQNPEGLYAVQEVIPKLANLAPALPVSIAVVTPERRHRRANRNTVNIPLATKFHHSQLPAMP